MEVEAESEEEAEEKAIAMFENNKNDYHNDSGGKS